MLSKAALGVGQNLFSEQLEVQRYVRGLWGVGGTSHSYEEVVGGSYEEVVGAVVGSGVDWSGCVGG